MGWEQQHCFSYVFILVDRDNSFPNATPKTVKGGRVGYAHQDFSEQLLMSHGDTRRHIKRAESTHNTQHVTRNTQQVTRNFSEQEAEPENI